MKIGLLMVICAIALFSATVVWSINQHVESNFFGINRESVRNLEPNRKTDHAYFYQANPGTYCKINAPVNVEIDESFTGFELTGDTSAFKYLLIYSGQSKMNSGQIYIEVPPRVSAEMDSVTGKIKSNTVKQDSNYFKILAAANITVRLGIGSGKEKQDCERQMSFYGCKNVKTTSAITGKKLFLIVDYTDSLAMQVNISYLDLYASGNDRQPTTIRLNGVSSRTYCRIRNSDLHAEQLNTAESYLARCNNAKLNIRATEIVNAQQLTGCNLNITGNPRYQRITDSQ